MAKKKFKAESQKLLDMMINSIYTHKEIFLRELISNASDAIDKLYFRSFDKGESGFSREDFFISIELDESKRQIILSDNGCGMTAEELDKDLGTIAASGTQIFQQENADADQSLIGQFGIGFYSAFMVSSQVQVETRAQGSDQAWRWTSNGADGYTITPCEKESVGTSITLFIKEDTEDERYSEYLEPYRLTQLVKKYSDYISYPIHLQYESAVYDENRKKTGETERVDRVLNSMIPLWRKSAADLTEEEYTSFYQEKFHDYLPPTKMIRASAEGRVTYDALLFIPDQPPMNFFSRDYEKGLQLYCNGVLIMEKCAELLPDYFSFVRGVVDSADLSLNVSREVLQNDHLLKLIARNIEKKIGNELAKMLKDEREKYEKFFQAFGLQIKFGICQEFGQHKETLQDLLLFYSSHDKSMVTLKEYAERMQEGQDFIYYACGETVDKCEILPQAEQVRDKGYEILYLVDYADEFVFNTMGTYAEKTFVNVAAADLELDTEEEKAALATANEQNSELLAQMQQALAGKVEAVRFTNKLKKFPVCLTTEGDITTGMAKVMNTLNKEMQQELKAKQALEINLEHAIAAKLQQLHEQDADALAKYAKILYAQACLIGGQEVENPAELTEMVCELMV